MDFNKLLNTFDDLGIKNEGLTPDDPSQQQLVKQNQIDVAVEQTAKTNEELSANDWAQLAGIIKENKFSGEPKQKAGDQVRGTEKATSAKKDEHPFKGRLVGEMANVEAKQQETQQALEKRISEKWQQFKNEKIQEYVVKPKDDQDKEAKLKALQDLLVDPATSKDPELKQAIQRRLAQLSETADNKPPATADYITKTIAKKITPGLDPDGREFEDEAYLYHTSELGRRDLMAKGGNWKAYYDAIKWHYKNANESVEEGLMLPPKMEYKGWTYSSHEEDYDDVVKLSHVATKDGKKVDMDWSPYNKPTDEEFKLWVDLGMPTRKAVNGIGPLDKDDLLSLAKTKQGTHKILQRESTEAEKRIATKLKNIERIKKGISDIEYKLHQERMKKERDQYVKDNPDSIYKEQESAIGGAAAPDDKAADVVKATQTLKTATQSPATTKTLAKAIDSASQGKTTSQQDMKALEPMMDVIKTAAENPELANQLKPLIAKAKQLQQQRSS